MRTYLETYAMDNQPWRQAEDDYLIKFYGKVSLTEMAKITGRSENTVTERLQKLGMLKSQNPNVKQKTKPGKRKKDRKFPAHLKEPLKIFICEIVEGNTSLQSVLRDRLKGMI